MSNAAFIASPAVEAPVEQAPVAAKRDDSLDAFSLI